MLWMLALTLAGAADRPHIVLVSMDTTRADALSCYGEMLSPTRGGSRVTPEIDDVAAEGIRFERFFATAPSTLSSHTTMLSGLDQHAHGVVRNGYPVSPDVRTLPQRLSDEGWDTIAVIGAGALESAMGLDRGFRHYDDHVSTLRGMMFQDRAEGVVARVFAALDARPERASPLFLFAHFYDPHTPYVPPHRHRKHIVDPEYAGSAIATGPRFAALTKKVRARAASGADVQHINELYLAEVAYMDEQIGVLLDGLEARGLLDHALVVLVADHGETLADNPVYAWSHGSNVNHEVMRVPLVMRGYGLMLAQRAVVRRQASMTGLAATIERAVGLEPTLGQDFYDLVRPGPVFDEDGWPGRPTLAAFMEATRPRHAEANRTWNNLPLHRGVFAGGWGAWRAPFAGRALTFYTHGRVPHPEVLRVLDAQLQAWDETTPPYRSPQMAPSTKAALEALGYVE